MRIIRLLICLPALAVFFIVSAVPFSACTKTKVDTVDITHDSSVYIHDTTHIHDTTRITDSVFDLTDGLVACYTFNGGSLSDSSGYQNDITFNNATATSDRYGR